MLNWKTVGIVAEGESISVGGVNPWDFKWRTSADSPIELPHPQYPSQLHRIQIYELETPERIVKFAAGELSANVWGFYLQES